MVDIKPIEDLVNEAVEIREELNGVHWKQYRDLQTVFQAMFGGATSDLKVVSDMNYYQGGYPSETSPPRLEALMLKVGMIAKYYNAVGRLDEVNEFLAMHGFSIAPLAEDVPIHRTKMSEVDDKKVTRALDRLYRGTDFVEKEDTREMLEWFLATTKSLQGTICGMADEIKITLYEQANEKIKSLDKGGFVTTVNTLASKRAKERANKDTDGIVTKALEKSETLETNGEVLRSFVENEPPPGSKVFTSQEELEDQD